MNKDDSWCEIASRKSDESSDYKPKMPEKFQNTSDESDRETRIKRKEKSKGRDRKVRKNDRKKKKKQRKIS